MQKLFLEELKKNTEFIKTVLSEDPFPESIEPECLRAAVRSYPFRGGKRIRPAILLWSCGALQGNIEKAVFAAAAIEIYHNWTLVHDDIIDGDEFRRNLPTTHVELATHAAAAYGASKSAAAKFGRDFAILTGDLQQAWAVDMFLRSTEKGVSPDLVIKLARMLQEKVNRELLSGEALDVEFPMKPLRSVSRRDVMKMMSGKTSSLLRFSAQCGGAIAIDSADFTKAPLACLGDFAESLGLAFQLRDDYLGVFGTKDEFGKPICSDFKERKHTVLCLEAWERLDDKGRAELAELSGLLAYGDVEIGKIRKLLSDCGAADAILRESEMLTDKAFEALNELPDGKYKKLLAELVRYLMKRNV